MTMRTRFDIERFTAPVPDVFAWEIESLLVRIFEYGDYSFRSALSGLYSATLNCTFFAARYRGRTVGAAGCLFRHRNPRIAIVGPVGVAEEYRGRGIGTNLLISVLNLLRQTGIRVVYLGTSKTNNAAAFFGKLGFQAYRGIVMRLSWGDADEFEKGYFATSTRLRVRSIVWGDMPAVSALAAFPCRMYTFDFHRGIFSSRYVMPDKFLSIFPGMMKGIGKNGGLANVLVSANSQKVVGLAYIQRQAGTARNHIAVLDFYLHDNFVEWADLLVRTTLSRSACPCVRKIYCYCLACDEIKRKIIEAIGGRRIALFQGAAKIENSFEDTIAYQLELHKSVHY